MDYDAIVLGGGAAGLAAARGATAAGMRTLLVTDGPPGGDCTFTGCVPSKTLIEAAADGLPFDKAMARVREAVAAIAATEDENVLRSEGIDILRGRARFIGRTTLDVDTAEGADGQRLSAPRVIVATGATPLLPPIPGLTDVPTLTTDTVFDLTEPLDSLAVLGGGAVGSELAQAFARLGVRVTLIEAADRLLPGIDREASALLTDVFRAEGIDVTTGATVESVRGDDSGVALRAGERTVTAQRLLVAAGRQPATAGLDLAAAGIATGERGEIRTDDHMATTAPGVFAAGDVTGRAELTHAAYAMGRIAAGAAVRRWRRPSWDAPIPSVVFTDPEIATVGIAEHEVTAARVRVAYLPMSEVDRAVTANATSGFVKLIAGPRRLLGNTGGGRLLGATVVGERAGELIAEPTLAMTSGMFTGRLAQAVHAYPTWSIAVQQAAAQFFGEFGGRTARPARMPEAGGQH
ncbi:dihydrolipoyl dehydrogenase family protein [Haloechinothrix salitolerans]|uniref:Dihydrolipoyl dehydrogenase family protein n=2 Tax=Haloechinothrix salitolerans TaxID=926830 RepID=A0ABW2C9K9_9PSEU